MAARKRDDKDDADVQDIQAEVLRRLAAWVLLLCRRNNYSEKFLADAAHIGRGHLSEILHAKSNVTVETLARLAHALDVEVTELLLPIDAKPLKRGRGRPKTRRNSGK